MRLTEKDYCGYDIKNRNNFNGYDNEEDSQNLFSCLQKLGQLEDIEEELGIDLVKLLSAKKVYYMGWDRNAEGLEIKETYKLFINLTDRTIEYYEHEYSEFTFDLELKDYGKNNIYGGWALTKEVLYESNND